MVRSQVGIQLYFWPRAKSAYVPTEIRELGSGGGLLDLDPSWGIPAANFPFFPNYCNYDEHFDAHQIIFDLTFCVSLCAFYCRLSRTEELVLPFSQGDWAGSVWPSSGCGNSTCENCKRIRRSIIVLINSRLHQMWTITRLLSAKPIGLSTACVYIPRRVLIDTIHPKCCRQQSIPCVRWTVLKRIYPPPPNRIMPHSFGCSLANLRHSFLHPLPPGL